MVYPGGLEFFLESIKAAEGLVDCVGNSARGIAALFRAHNLPEHGVVHVSAAIIANDAANVFRQRGQIADQLFRALASQFRVFLNCTVQLGNVSRMVLVMVQVHGLIVNVRLQRVVLIGQRRDLMCRYSCHFNHLSFINTGLKFG